MLEFASPEAPSRVAELEWPKEVARLLEIGADSDDFVDQILHTDDAVLAKIVFDQLVVGERDALLVNLAISAFVDELSHSLERRIAVGDPRLHDLEHFSGCLCEAHKHAIVDLEQTEKLEDFARLWCNLVDTARVRLISWVTLQEQICLELTP